MTSAERLRELGDDASLTANERIACGAGAGALALLSDLEWRGSACDTDTYTCCGCACPACGAPELADDPTKNGTHADDCKLLALLRAAGLRP